MHHITRKKTACAVRPETPPRRGSPQYAAANSHARPAAWRNDIDDVSKVTAPPRGIMAPSSGSLCGYSAVRAVCYARVERRVECHTAAGSCAALIVAASYQEVADPGTPPGRLFGPSVWTPHIGSSGKLAVTAPLTGRGRSEGGCVQRRDPALRSSRAERVAADLEHEILTARLPVGAHLGRRSEIMDRFGYQPDRDERDAAHPA